MLSGVAADPRGISALAVALLCAALALSLSEELWVRSGARGLARLARAQLGPALLATCAVLLQTIYLATLLETGDPLRALNEVLAWPGRALRSGEDAWIALVCQLDLAGVVALASGIAATDEPWEVVRGRAWRAWLGLSGVCAGLLFLLPPLQVGLGLVAAAMFLLLNLVLVPLLALGLLVTDSFCGLARPRPPRVIRYRDLFE